MDGFVQNPTEVFDTGINFIPPNEPCKWYQHEGPESTNLKKHLTHIFK